MRFPLALPFLIGPIREGASLICLLSHKMRTPLDETYYRAFETAAKALSAGDSESARAALSVAMERTADAEYGRFSVRLPRLAAVFARDQYTCRYCGRRTLALPVLNAIADVMPDVLARDSGAWKAHLTDIVFLKISASADHVQPVTRGGTGDPDNLVTACWLCNSTKQNYTLSEIEWALLPRPMVAWDGLATSLDDIMKVELMHILSAAPW